MFKDKSVLVTGGSGMVGRELVDLLLGEGAKVFVADINEPTNASEEITFRKVDLRNYEDCKLVCKDMDFVFNVVGIKASPKMCQPSKNDWFGGWAKRIGELQCQAYEVQDGKSNCSIVRPANVYGRYDNFDPRTAMVIPSLIRKASENEILEVWGDGTTIRDFIHARDVARGMIHVVKNKITEPVNLGSGTGIEIKTIADVISKKFEKKISWVTDAPKGDPKRVFDMSRAKGHGFELSISIEDGILDTIEWFNDNKDIIDNRFDVFKDKR